jgi:hypothetical protein
MYCPSLQMNYRLIAIQKMTMLLLWDVGITTGVLSMEGMVEVITTVILMSEDDASLSTKLLARTE